MSYLGLEINPPPEYFIIGNDIAKKAFFR